MSRCATCGNYNDLYEWPEDERINFRQNMCYACYSEARDNGSFDDEEDPSELPEQPDDSDVDDSPIFNEEQTPNEESTDDDTETDSSPDSTSIQNLRKLLFG